MSLLLRLLSPNEGVIGRNPNTLECSMNLSKYAPSPSTSVRNVIQYVEDGEEAGDADEDDDDVVIVRWI